MFEYLLRFIAGGLAVSAFAALGDALRPKSFAGLFRRCPVDCPGDPPHHLVAEGRVRSRLWKAGR